MDFVRLAPAVHNWLHSVVVVTFDVDVGQRVESTVPPDVFNSSELDTIAFLALPDSNGITYSEVVYSFRLRRQLGVPLHGCSPHEHRFLFGYVYFCQRRDPSLPRGFFQKSLVIMSHLPFVDLFEAAIRKVGPLYFEYGAKFLEECWGCVAKWPPPAPGAALTLPLAGDTLRFRVPRLLVGLPMVAGWGSDAAAAAAAAAGGRPTRIESRATAVSLSAEPDDITDTPAHDRTRGRAALRAAAAADEAAAPPSASVASTDADELEAAAGGSAVIRASIEAAAEGGGAGPAGGSRMLALRSTSATASDAAPSDASSGASSEVEGDVTPGASPSSPHRRARPPQLDGAALPLPESPGGSSPSLAALAQSLDCEGVGLFQSMPLFSTFRDATAALWHMWELALTAQPLLVLGETPAQCSHAVLAISSLIAPVPYRADFRPYITMYDNDFKEVLARHDRGEAVCVLIGATNPFFLKALRRWPNVLTLPSAQVLARVAAKSGIKEKSSREMRKYSHTLLKPGVSMSDVVPEDKVFQKQTTMFTRRKPLISPDKHVLKQLLHVRQQDVSSPEPQLRIANGACCFTSDPSADKDIPAVVINNGLLRQHFRKLTQQFLQPFDRYFHIAQATQFARGGTSAAGDRPSGVSIGPYDDPMQLMEAFDTEAFLSQLRKPALPPSLKSANWQLLYREFTQSPHFWPWFNDRRMAEVARLDELSHALRMSLLPASLRSQALCMTVQERVALRDRILACVERERARLATSPAIGSPVVNAEDLGCIGLPRSKSGVAAGGRGGASSSPLLARMEQHLAAVEDTIPDAPR